MSKDIQNPGSCPPEEQLEAFVSGACAAEEAACIEAHMEQCAVCRQWIEEARANQAVFESVQRVMRRSTSGIPRNPQTGALLIEGYEILEEIGRGGMGVVYMARQTGTKRIVALKVMLEGPLASESVRRRFEREIELAASLNHPNIVGIHDSGLSHGRYYFAMDYIAGQRLDRYVKDREMPVAERLALMQKVCQAVHYAHQRGVIHRDLKPSNILVDEQGEPHILDFGLAKTVASAPGESLLISISGEVLGTLPYMAPEQARGESHEIDCRTDVYALGVIFYELLTGKYPYPVVGQMAEVLKNIAEAEPARPSTIYRTIKDDLETIVLKTLSKEKELRYDTAGALGADIGRYVAGEAIEAKRDSGWYVLRKSLRRHKWAVGVAAVFLVLASVASVVTFSLYKRADQQAKIAQTAEASALAERQRAEENARQLADELAGRTIEEARNLALAGDVTQAESLLWREFLQRPGDPYALWTLRELYARQACLGKVRASRAPVATIAFDPAGKTLVSADLEGVIKLWEMPACRHSGTFITQARDITSVCVSPNGKWLACSSSDETVRLLDAASGKVIYKWTTLADAAVQPAAGEEGRTAGINCRPAYRLAFSPDGRKLAGCAGRDVQLWDVASGATLGRLAGHLGEVTTVAFSGDGATLASGSKDRTVILWDVKRGERRATLSSHLDSVSCVAFSRDSQLVASASWDGSVIVWQASNGACLASLEGFGCWVHSVAFGPDGGTLATGDIQGGVRLWELASGKCVRSIPAHAEGMQEALRPAVAVAFAPQGDILATTSGTFGTVKLWDLSKNRDMLKLAETTGPVATVAFDGAGKTLTARGSDGSACVVDLVSGQCEMAEERTGGPAERHASGDWDDPQMADRHDSPAYSPDGRHVAIIEGTVVQVRDAKTKELVASLKGHSGRIWCTAFRPDGQWLASAGDDGAKLWEIGSGTALPILQNHQGPAYCVAFSPDGVTLATAGQRGIRLWQVPSGRLVATLLGDERMAWGLRFSPDGRLLACGGAAGLRVWDLARYDRCLLGNYAYYLELARGSAELAGRVKAEDVDRWAKGLAAAREPGLWMTEAAGVEMPGVPPHPAVSTVLQPDGHHPVVAGPFAADRTVAPGTQAGVAPETVAQWGQLTRHRLLFSLRGMGQQPVEAAPGVAGAMDPPAAALTFAAGDGTTKRHTLTPSGLSVERLRSAEYQQQRRSAAAATPVASQPASPVRASAG